MHVARIEIRSLDETAEAVDLGQSPAEIVLLSFTDSDLAAFAGAYSRMPEPRPSLRLAHLAALKHPFSVDLYLEKVCAGARFVLVRLLGGMDYWRYGVEQLAALARAKGIALALVPGDRFDDVRLAEASTLEADALRRLWAYFDAGGPDNMAACLAFAAGGVPREVREVAAFGIYEAREPSLFARAKEVSLPFSRSRGRRWREAPDEGLPTYECPHHDPLPRRAEEEGPRALLVFYRSIYLADDLAPIDALASGLAARGFAVTCVYVTSLKDPVARAPLSELIAREAFDVVVNATAFSARGDDGGALDAADAPVLQVALAAASLEAWAASTRGLSPADLAMNVALPEVDGRILTRAISFKRALPRDDLVQFARLVHAPHADRVDYVADIASAWARLRQKPRFGRRLACVLSDYPAKGGRVGYAVGLDTPASVVAIVDAMRSAGYDFGDGVEAEAVIADLSQGPETAVIRVADYVERFARLPDAFRGRVTDVWGAPEADPAARDGAFMFRALRLGKLIVSVQPDRGRADARKDQYHDLALPPRHAYVAFYIWLREVEQIDAMIHLGAHGTLEWLPGKAVALSRDCAVEATLGAVPVIYPFIVNNPGEAAQAKRRIGAVTVGHLSPPLIEAGAHGAAQELEALFDEFSQAQALDPRRASIIADLILERAGEAGLLRECDADGVDRDAALRKLDGWLCELKDMRIGDGMHVFGVDPPLPPQAVMTGPVPVIHVDARSTGPRFPAPVEPSCRSFLSGASFMNADVDDRDEPGHDGVGAPSSVPIGIISARAESGAAFSREEREKGCGAAEIAGLLRALDGRFVPPGPSGAPSRGRLDVLPTGRNLFAIDPRAVPTRNAWDIGRRAAEEVVARHAQDHGDWPRRIVLDLWGSASMRTGGEEIAQAFAFIGARPKWDHASSRVNAFEILPLAMLGRPRVDVTIRISGLFRDVFPTQIALLDAAFRAVAALDESSEENPLRGEPASRIFGAAPGAYGVGLGGALASGAWGTRDDLGRAYLAATSHAYDGEGEGRAAGADFAQRIARADALVHVQDMAGQDVLDSDAFAEHEGGFAAAAASLGASPEVYHVDTTRSERAVARPLRQEIARVLRARATNPRWIAGQMRHGHRGAAEIAETLDNLFAYAALTDAVESRQFDLYFDATLGDENVRDFLVAANPLAARGMAEKFDEARRRGLWVSRRNSIAEILVEMRERVA
jgi:cobaltochelatase CobN